MRKKKKLNSRSQIVYLNETDYINYPGQSKIPELPGFHVSQMKPCEILYVLVWVSLNILASIINQDCVDGANYPVTEETRHTDLCLQLTVLLRSAAVPFLNRH